MTENPGPLRIIFERHGDIVSFRLDDESRKRVPERMNPRFTVSVDAQTFSALETSSAPKFGPIVRDIAEFLTGLKAPKLGELRCVVMEQRTGRVVWRFGKG